MISLKNISLSDAIKWACHAAMPAMTFCFGQRRLQISNRGFSVNKRLSTLLRQTSYKHLFTMKKPRGDETIRNSAGEESIHSAGDSMGKETCTGDTKAQSFQTKAEIFQSHIVTLT